MGAIANPRAGGVELGYAEITADATNATTSFADVPGLSCTVTVGARPIRVIFSAGGVLNTADAGGVEIRLLEDGSLIGAAQQLLSGANRDVPFHRPIRRNPSAGQHVYKIQMKAIITGTATIKADNAAQYGPAYLQVLEV